MNEMTKEGNVRLEGEEEGEEEVWKQLIRKHFYTNFSKEYGKFD